MKNEQNSLWNSLDLRRTPNKERSYWEILTIPLIATVAVGIILLALLLHVFDYGGITRSTVKREPLEVELADEVKLAADVELGDEDGLVDAIEYFRNKTGVAPYVVIHDGDIDIDTNFEEKCTPDQMMIACNTSTGKIYYKVGGGAAKVLDGEALIIFDEYIEYYADIADSADENLEYAMRATARRIMDVTTVINGVRYQFFVGIAVAVIIELIFIIKMVVGIKQKRAG